MKPIVDDKCDYAQNLSLLRHATAQSGRTDGANLRLLTTSVTSKGPIIRAQQQRWDYFSISEAQLSRTESGAALGSSSLLAIRNLCPSLLTS